MHNLAILVTLVYSVQYISLQWLFYSIVYSILRYDLKQGAEKTQVEPYVGVAVPVQFNVTLYTPCILYSVHCTIYNILCTSIGKGL